MARTFADARRWSADGTTLLLDLVGSPGSGLTEEQYAAPTLLPGWTRQHLVAHLASNAEALGNLVHWAASGEVTPMYASAEDRAAGIARGPRLPAAELTAWLGHSAAALESSMGWLTERQWRAPVVTAQRRTVPATELAWMRAREVLVHAVDLDLGVGFGDLPGRFLDALVEDACAKRQLDSSALPAGPPAQVAAWLAGRPHTIADAPELGPWL